MAERLTIGNTAERAEPKDGNPRYNWTFYVRGATHYVDTVVVKLHPTFKDPVRTLHAPSFELVSNGWGTFKLDVEVKWKTGRTSCYTWELQFGAPDASKDVEVPPEVSSGGGAETEAAPPPKAAYPMKSKASKPPAPKAKMLIKGGRQSQAPSGPQKLFEAEEDLADKLVGVVVTIFEGSSYDEMFREVRPTTVPGERISTYSIGCRDVGLLRSYLDGSEPVPDGQPMWRCLVDDVNQVEADSVVFNWECCSSCGDNCFPCPRGRPGAFRDEPAEAEPEMEPERERRRSRAEGGSPTMQLVALAMRRGFTAMFSDFSLKSLLYEWSVEHLGPNPFVKVGRCDRQFQLEFVPAELQHEDVPQQLQIVGQLCSDQGKAIVAAMGDTILYTVDPKRPETELYSLKVLTVVTDYASPSFERRGAPAEDLKCSVGRGTLGLAGHVTLTYALGGQLITSMGHWSELTKIDTSLEAVLRVAGHEFGEEEVASMRAEYASKSSAAERAECVQERAQSMVKKSAPSRMKGKTKY